MKTLSDLTELSDAELIAEWRRGNDNGEGWDIGHETDELDALTEEGWTFVRWVGDEHCQFAAWASECGQVAIVADGHGPWAVTVEA